MTALDIKDKIEGILNKHGVTTEATDENMWVIRTNEGLIDAINTLFQQEREEAVRNFLNHFSADGGDFFATTNTGYLHLSISKKTVNEYLSQIRKDLND